jgi:hypothetical protein
MLGPVLAVEYRLVRAAPAGVSGRESADGGTDRVREVPTPLQPDVQSLSILQHARRRRASRFSRTGGASRAGDVSSVREAVQSHIHQVPVLRSARDGTGTDHQA